MAVLEISEASDSPQLPSTHHQLWITKTRNRWISLSFLSKLWWCARNSLYTHGRQNLLRFCSSAVGICSWSLMTHGWRRKIELLFLLGPTVEQPWTLPKKDEKKDESFFFFIFLWRPRPWWFGSDIISYFITFLSFPFFFHPETGSLGPTVWRLQTVGSWTWFWRIFF